MLEEFTRKKEEKEGWSFQRCFLGGRCDWSRASKDEKDLVRRTKQQEKKPGDYMPSRQLELYG